MSGTLMKNNATEYFVPLNIVRPEKYWRFNSFCQNNVRYEAVRSVTGKIVNKYTGLLYPDTFLKNNKDIMIRRTTDEVMSELPKLWKQPKYIELDAKLKDLYDESEKEFAEWFDNASAMEIRNNILGQLALLRHQTSLAKVDYTIDLAMEHILQTGRKIAIFTHHIDSRELLADRMIDFFKKTDEGLGEPIYGNVVRVLTQGSKDVQKEIDEFKNSETEKIIILSTLAHGESINLQFMADCILHERQWNPANEDQAISGRFRRIGQESKSIICQIPTAIGTIDEYLVALNERKGVNASEIDTGVIGSYDTDFVRELAEKIAEKGRAKWKL
jgi:SNF2 family DNA or RNA helicase